MNLLRREGGREGKERGRRAGKERGEGGKENEVLSTVRDYGGPKEFLIVALLLRTTITNGLLSHSAPHK